MVDVENQLVIIQIIILQIMILQIIDPSNQIILVSNIKCLINDDCSMYRTF